MWHEKLLNNIHNMTWWNKKCKCYNWLKHNVKIWCIKEKCSIYPNKTFHRIYSRPLSIHVESLRCLTLIAGLFRRNRHKQRLNYYRECPLFWPLYRTSPPINTRNYRRFQTTTDIIWLKLSIIYHKLVTEHYYSRYQTSID